MPDKTQIQKSIFQAMDRVNEVLLDENTLRKDAATILLGEGAQLDSMGFVNFVVALEEILAGGGLNLSLVEEINAQGDAVPKTMTVASLADFLFTLAQQKTADGN
jgi:acyl carrier protein